LIRNNILRIIIRSYNIYILTYFSEGRAITQATPLPPGVQGRKLRCAIYTRVSTDNQAEKEFNSCEAQEARIKSFIKKLKSFGL